MKRLENRIAVVTGAAMGNGLGAAKVLAKNGATLLLLDVSAKVHETAQLLIADGARAEGFIVDVCDSAGLEKFAKGAAEKYGKLDILVNNAGVCNVVPFLELSDAVRDRMFNINIKGVWNCSKAILPYMVKAKYGKIVNLSSVTGPMVVDAGETAYATTKAAIWGFTKALATEFAACGITVNAVCPGYIDTPMAWSIANESCPENPQSVIDGIASAVPMKRLGTIEELGDLVAFLASDESRYITGTQVVIDGGSTLPESFSAVGV
jgi:NAD(P)-dependent dehydrogenase (short-subunit alcohol dehydrogenase family)